MAQVFISYSRKDKDFVRKLGEALVAQKREAWVDWKDIPLTAEWQKEILTNIENAENFIFIISPESAASPNCRKEIDHAVANHKRMIPILYRAVPDEAIPEALGKFQRMDFGEEDEFGSKFAALIAALDTDLAWVQMHTRLLTRAKEWEREAKDGSFLLRGKDLREAEQWVARSAEKEPTPTTLHSQYILASRQSATRVQRLITGAGSAALLIAIGLAIYAFMQKSTAQRNARESKARELVAFATESLNEDPEKSILLSLQAVGATLRFGEPQLIVAQDMLHQAILASRMRLTLSGHARIVQSVAWSPDGRRLATGSWDRTAKVWDAASGKDLLTLPAAGIVGSVAWSPDGKWLATASDGNVKMWNIATGQVVLTLRDGNSSGDSVAWSPDGKRLATASKSATAEIWDAVTGQKIQTLDGDSWANSVAVEPGW